MLRDQLYVQAAIAGGTSTFRILVRHIMPNTIPPLIVQATYICAQAVIFEAYLSFVGAGTPPEVPSWGNIMARSEEHTSELQSRGHLVCRLLLAKLKTF